MGCTNCSEITLFRGEDGAAGSNGTNGTNGTNGADGVYGGWSSEWLFDNGLGVSPVAGDFRLNTAPFATVTQIFINDTNADATDLAAFLAAFNNSGNFGLIKISKKSDSSIFWMGVVTAASDSGSYYTITVTYTSSSVAVFADDDPCIISFVRNGVDGTNGASGIDLYDSGWKTINDYNGTFGLPAFTNWTHPKIRVIGRHVYISGRLLIPLADPSTPTVLIPDASDYTVAHNDKVQTCSTSDGGFLIDSAGGGLTSNNPIIPTELTPTEDHNIEEQELIFRAIKSSGAHGLNLTTFLPIIRLLTNGKVIVTSFQDALDSGGTPSYNTPFHTFIMNVTNGETAINYQNYKQQYLTTAAVTTFEVLDAGNGYTGAATSTGVTTTAILPGTGSGMICTVEINQGGKILSVTPTTPGSGYTDGDYITLDATTGTPAIGTPTANLAAVIKVNVSSVLVDDRVISVSPARYPVTFDGLNVAQFGGFIIPFTLNYPLSDSVTEAQIIAAIASI